MGYSWEVYLDTMSGSAGPAMVGHASPEVGEAVARQMATLPKTDILHKSVRVEFAAGSSPNRGTC